MAGAVNITLGAIVTDFIASMKAAQASSAQLGATLNTNLAAGFAASDRQQRVFDQGLGRLGENMQKVGRYASVITAGIALIGVTSFKTYAGIKALQAAFLFLTGPIGAVVLAGTALVGALAVLGFSIQQYSTIASSSADKAAILAETNDKVTASIAGETTRLNTLVAVARDETVSKKARLQAVKDINDISPQYLGNIRLETINTAQATSAISQYTNALTLKAKVQTLSQQAADAAIAADRVAAKSAKEFVNKDRFSADRIAINIKTTASFSPGEDADKLFDELGRKRKDAEVKRAQDAAKIINEELKKAYANAAKSNIVVDAPKLKPFDYSKVDLGGSAFKKAKDRLKELKDEIASGKLSGKDVSALQVEYDKLKGSLDGASDSFKKHTAAVTGTVSPLSTNARILKQLTQELKEQGSLPNKDLQNRVALFKELVEQEKQAVNFKPVDLGDKLKPAKANISVTAALNGPVLPGLADFQKQFGSLDYYQNELGKIKAQIQDFSLKGLVVPDSAISALNFYNQKIAQTGEALATAENAAESKRLNLLPKIGGLQIPGLNLELFNDSANTLQQRIQGLGQSITSSLQQAAGSAAEGMGALLGGLLAGTAQLSDIPALIGNIFGNLAKTMGQSLIAFGTAGLAAKAFVSNPVTAIIAGIGLIALGTALQASFQKSASNVKGYAGGGLFLGSSFINVGENSRALSGGGEFVAPVSLGADLISDRIMKNLKFNTTPELLRPDVRNLRSASQDVRLSGEFRLRSGDLVASIDDYNQNQAYYN